MTNCEARIDRRGRKDRLGGRSGDVATGPNDNSSLDIDGEGISSEMSDVRIIVRILWIIVEERVDVGKYPPPSGKALLKGFGRERGMRRGSVSASGPGLVG